jgi:hypothetical protein
MSQEQNNTQLPLIGGFLLGLLMVAGLLTWQRQRQPARVSAMARQKTKTSPEEALRYWTADKKRKAKPAPMPHIDTSNQEKKQPQRPQTPSDTPEA